MSRRCYIIAGPNGAGKTTFAKHFLPLEAHCIRFVNADLIAGGLSPFAPDLAAIKASRLMIQEIDECILKGVDFAFETTLSGKTYVKKIKAMQTYGYRVILYFLKVGSLSLAIERVRRRVAKGGHDVPRRDIERRFHKGWENFQNIYKKLVDHWVIFDTSGCSPVFIDSSGGLEWRIDEIGS